MGVKQGFKKTEVGNLPDDWRVLSLDNCCNFENGDRSSNYPSPTSFRSSGVPFINAGHLESGRIKQEALDFISQSAYEKLSGGKVNAGDILFCLRGSLGKFGVVGNDFGPGAIASSLVIIRPKTSSFNLGYLSHYFSSWLCERMIELWAGGAAQPNLGASDLQRFLVPLPPTLTEQEAIAGALSDADAWIESLEQLIAKKRQIKQGAMQELLTGKRRLPGFSGEWETKRLGDIGVAVAGLTYSPGDVAENGTLVLRASNVDAGTLVFQDNVFVEMDLPDTVFVKSGDILICVRNGSRDLIGKCAKIGFRSEAERHVFGAFMCVYRTEFHDFVFHQFQSDIIKRQISEHLGATINQITNKNLNSFAIPIPSKDEQQSIAAVLSDMDTEIESLESKLAKARQIKQGMMQELLTGRIRLV